MRKILIALFMCLFVTNGYAQKSLQESPKIDHYGLNQKISKNCMICVEYDKNGQLKDHTFEKYVIADFNGDGFKDYLIVTIMPTAVTAVYNLVIRQLNSNAQNKNYQGRLVDIFMNVENKEPQISLEDDDHLLKIEYSEALMDSGFKTRTQEIHQDNTGDFLFAGWKQDKVTGAYADIRP